MSRAHFRQRFLNQPSDSGNRTVTTLHTCTREDYNTLCLRQEFGGLAQKVLLHGYEANEARHARSRSCGQEPSQVTSRQNVASSLKRCDVTCCSGAVVCCGDNKRWLGHDMSPIQFRDWVRSRALHRNLSPAAKGQTYHFSLSRAHRATAVVVQERDPNDSEQPPWLEPNKLPVK